MSLQRAYVLLAGLYSLLPVMGVVAIFAGGGNAAGHGALVLRSARRGGAVGIHLESRHDEPTHVAAAGSGLVSR